MNKQINRLQCSFWLYSSCQNKPALHNKARCPGRGMYASAVSHGIVWHAVEEWTIGRGIRVALNANGGQCHFHVSSNSASASVSVLTFSIKKEYCYWVAFRKINPAFLIDCGIYRLKWWVLLYFNCTYYNKFRCMYNLNPFKIKHCKIDIKKYSKMTFFNTSHKPKTQQA